MVNEVFDATATEALEVLLEVGLGGLASVADGECLVLVVISGGAGLKEMSAGLVNTADKETNSERAFARVERFELGLSRNFSDNTFARVLRLVGVPVVEAFTSEELGQETCISCHSGNNDAHMVINFEDLLLMGGKIMGAHFKTDQHLL